MSNRSEIEIHPAAAIFPAAGDVELQALADDIKRNGLLNPIVLHPDGRILDGRNRDKACRLAGVKARFTKWGGTNGSELDYVVSQNLHRRHLTVSQKAIIAARVANYTHGGDRSKGTNDSLKISRNEAAAIFGVSEKSVDRAAKLLAKSNAELIEAAETNRITVNTAYSLANLPPDELELALQSTDPKVLREAVKRHKKMKAGANAPRKTDGLLRWTFDQAAVRLKNTVQLVVLDVRDPETRHTRLGHAAQSLPSALQSDAVVACLARPKDLAQVIASVSAVAEYQTTCACLVGSRIEPEEWIPVAVFSASEPAVPSIIRVVDRDHAPDAVANAFRSNGSAVWLPVWEPHQIDDKAPSGDSTQSEPANGDATEMNDMVVMEL